MSEITPTKNNIILDLVIEEAYDLIKGKKKVVKDPQGNIQYRRHDVTGIMMLLDKLDTRVHTMKELKMWTKVKDRLREAYFEKKNKLELTAEQAVFLKEYLTNFQERDGKDIQPREFEVRTLIGITEQLET